MTPITDAIDTDVTEQKIPGGSVTYVDVSGPLARKKTYKLYFDNPANYYSLQALVGTISTLVDIDGTASNVLLKQLTRSSRYPGAGQTEADAVFWGVSGT